MQKPLTEPRDLRGGASVWADTPRIRVRARRNLGAVTCDVVVVGAGVSGAICALKLAEAGHRVVVLDRRGPVTGSTLASTAMIQFEVDTPLLELGEKIGRRRAERAYRRAFDGVAALSKLIEERGLSCGWRERDALYLSGDEAGFRKLREEAEARAKIGLPSAFLDRAELKERYGFDRTGAILSSGNAEVNPAQLAAGCLRLAQGLGAEIYSPHEVRDIVAGEGEVSVRTASGLAVIAGKAVFATGYETLAQIPKAKYDIISTWAIATTPLPVEAFWPTRCLVWEAASPYVYMRSTVDNRIVVGGEDAPFEDEDKRDALIGQKSRTLMCKLSALLPGRDLKLDYAWSGTFADSPTGLPHIAEAEGLPNCFAVLGCGGNGITFSMIAAEIATAWAGGGRDPDADLFA